MHRVTNTVYCNFVKSTKVTDIYFRLPESLFIYLFIYLFFVYLFIYLLTYLFIYLFIYLLHRRTRSTHTIIEHKTQEQEK